LNSVGESVTVGRVTERVTAGCAKWG
jgi:hypothetical protein